MIDSTPTPSLRQPSPDPARPQRWQAANQRLPPRGQRVLVLTRRGVVHEATFEVAYTDSWPEGVSWRLANGHTAIPFTDAAYWTDDLAAPPPEATSDANSEDDAPPHVPPAITGELRVELAETGRVLAQLPAAHLDWAPHPAVPTLRQLSYRVVRVAARIGWILDLAEVELTFEPDFPVLETVDQIVTAYQANEAVATKLALRVDGEGLRAPWRLERNGHLVAEMPRGTALRRFGLRPVVQHRGELTLMLSALGVPTADSTSEWPFRGEGTRPAAWQT